MSTRTVTISGSDLEDLKSKLSSSDNGLSDQQKQFTQYLVERAETGRKAEASDQGAMWQWTYRF